MLRGRRDRAPRSAAIDDLFGEGVGRFLVSGAPAAVEALDADYELIGTVGGDELRIGDLGWALNALTGARETLAPAFA